MQNCVSSLRLQNHGFVCVCVFVVLLFYNSHRRRFTEGVLNIRKNTRGPEFKWRTSCELRAFAVKVQKCLFMFTEDLGHCSDYMGGSDELQLSQSRCSDGPLRPLPRRTGLRQPHQKASASASARRTSRVLTSSPGTAGTHFFLWSAF